MRLWERLLGHEEARDNPLSWDAYQELLTFGGLQYPMLQTTMGKLDEEQIAATANAAYKSNGIVFALVLARLQVFSQVRFQWTRFVQGHPSDLFGSPELSVLEKPWRGGTTADLLARMEVDASLAGTAYIRRTTATRLNRMRPDRVIIVMGSNEHANHPSEAADVELLGYAYQPPNGRMVLLEPFEVAHYAPVPDPDNNFLGQSWITSVLTDVQADDASNVHKRAFFTNAAPQPLSARVLTPTGWATMGGLRVGSRVIGSDGRGHDVTGVFPQGVKPIYQVRFGDGVTAECTLDHVWQVSNNYDRRRGVTRKMTLAELMEDGFHYPSGPAKWAVPMVDPVEFEDHPTLPVRPYLMGLLLGDGSFRSNGKGSGGVTLACAAADVDETVDTITPMLPPGVTISRRDRGGWSELYFRGRGGPAPNPFTNAIRDLGLFNVPGGEKFIPAPYLVGPVKDRVALLQGLVDSDGSVGATSVRYTTSSARLADDIADLVGSLGGVATVRPNKNRSTLTVTVRQLPDWIVPARLLRKAGRYAPSGALRVRTIVGAEWVRDEEAQCIQVDSGDHLYVTDNYVLTHNTPNLAIKFDPMVTVDQVRNFKALLEEEHRGAWNAWKTLYLGGGADPVVIGKDFKELEFAVTQGKGESRLASAAGVPPSWVGFSEGLQGSALNAGNFTAARRRFGDGTMRHLWANACASLEPIIRKPDDSASLWYATGGVSFLAEDAKDAADIQFRKSQTIRQYIDAGFTPESSVAAVEVDDRRLLVHTGLYSVQLQKPGQGTVSVSDRAVIAMLIDNGWSPVLDRGIEPGGDRADNQE